VRDGVLYVEGQPSGKWLDDLRSRALLIPGIRTVELGRLTGERAAFDDAKYKIQAEIVRFPAASDSVPRLKMQTSGSSCR
jgi:hypothetical protein